MLNSCPNLFVINNIICLVLQSTVALTEIFKVEEAFEAVIENYHRILSAIMVRIASTISTLPPKQKPVSLKTLSSQILLLWPFY